MHEIGLVPDLVFGLAVPDGSRHCFMVEIDRGTMPIVHANFLQGGRPQVAAALQEGQKYANIHARSGVIGRIPHNTSSMVLFLAHG